MQDYLAHHGILGMRWGVRRYQNEDGSLTPAGKQRVNKATQYEEDASSLSQEELNQRLNRLRQEKEYNRLNEEARIANMTPDELRAKEAREYGEKFARDTGRKILEGARDSVIQGLTEGGKQFISTSVNSALKATSTKAEQRRQDKKDKAVASNNVAKPVSGIPTTPTGWNSGSNRSYTVTNTNPYADKKKAASNRLKSYGYKYY